MYLAALKIIPRHDITPRSAAKTIQTAMIQIEEQFRHGHGCLHLCACGCKCGHMSVAVMSSPTPHKIPNMIICGAVDGVMSIPFRK